MIHRKTKIIAGVSVAFFLACVLISVSFVYRVYSAKALYAAKTYDRALMILREASIDSLTQTLTNTRDDRAFVQTRIIEDEGVIDLLSNIEALGREQGVALETRSLTVQSLNNTFEYLVMSFEMQGTYDGITQLVTLLEALPYQVSVTSVRLGRGVSEYGGWQASVSMRITKFKKE